MLYFLPTPRNYFIYIISFIILLTTTDSQNSSMIIQLNKTTTITNKELYGDFVNITRLSTLQVDFENVNKNVSFIIFQVHSHLYNVTLYNNTFVQGSYINGTNVGLYSSVKPNLDTFYIYNSNDNVDLKLYISVHGYRSKDPIPGGCNMEFPVYISPFLYIYYNKDYMYVEAAPAQSSGDTTCTAINKVEVIFYRMYLPERNFDADTYFEGIRSMMTLENIQENGKYVTATSSQSHMRRILSTYRGTGSIYVAVAYSATGTSVYVPASTYACSPLDEGDCELLDDALSQLFCASLLFIGVFICYFGHRFFKTEMFLIGVLTGVLVTYILISLIADLNHPGLLGASLLSGLCFGGIWLMFWWFYGIPVLAVLLPSLALGFTLSAIVYFHLPDGLPLLQENANFWTVFILIMLLTSLMLVSATFLSNILCCAILGAYATVYPIDYYIGSNLKYIVINVVRRAVVPKFNKAVISPPFEMNDALVVCLWVTLATTGFLVQYYHSRGRPPFPPPPRSTRPTRPEAWTQYGATGSFTQDDGGNGGRWIGNGPSTSTSRPTSYNERTPLLA